MDGAISDERGFAPKAGRDSFGRLEGSAVFFPELVWTQEQQHRPRQERDPSSSSPRVQACRLSALRIIQ